MAILNKVMVAMVTPFNDLGKIDYKACVNIIERCIHDQVDGLVLCGTTGECSALSLKEKEELLSFVIKIVNHRMSIWMGCGTNSTETTLENVKMAAQYPVDGIMLITPYYVRPSQEGLYQHFKRVADTIDLPIMLYNVPKRTGIDMRSETVIRLCKDCPNIIALKQASNDFEDTAKIIQGCDCIILSGDDGLLMEGLKCGMDGIVSVVGHLHAPLIRHIIENYELGIQDQISDQKLKKLTRVFFMVSSPSDIKYLMSLQNLCTEIVRLPLVSLNNEQKLQAKQLLDKI